MSKSRLIMVVDDEPVIRDVLCSYLEKKGYETVALPDGQTAISYAKHRKPDLVLLDIKMPGLNGIETCRVLKQMLQSSPATGIIIITAYDSRKNVEKAYSSGAIDVVRKPLDLEDVTHRINTWLNLSIFENELERILVYADEVRSHNEENHNV